jgi:hypothetical protein
MTPEAREAAVAAVAAQEERMLQHGRLQNLLHASGGLAAVRPDASIGRKEVAEWSDFMEQGLSELEGAIAKLSVTSPS